MESHLELTTEPISPPLTTGASESGNDGAIVTFWGVVRGSERGQTIAGLEYSAHEAMARHQFEILFRTAAERWPIHALQLIHRLGFVAAGEPSLWIEVRSSHRAEAFAACQWIIDEMKRVVPIWKKVKSERLT